MHLLLPLLLSISKLSAGDISPQAQTYLDKALDIIQDKSIKRNTDWMEMRRLAYEIAANAKTPADTYPAIRVALRFLKDRHSSLLTPSDVKQDDTGLRRSFGFLPAHGYVVQVTPKGPADRAGLQAGMKLLSIDGKGFHNDKEMFELFGSAGEALRLRCQAASGASRTIRVPRAVHDGFNPPFCTMLKGAYGYVRVPGFGGVGAGMSRFSNAIQSGIRKLDTPRLKGWIVDLRINTGGNMFPMIAGLGPLLGNGDLGRFRTAQEEESWFYRDGKSGVEKETLVSIAPYRLKRPGLPVVVLIEDFTASSGEATAISFIGLPNVVTMGEPTAGLTTGNEFEMLGDGAVINLCEAVELDRTGKVYGGVIRPDVPVRTTWSDFGGPTDRAILEAMKSIDARKGDSTTRRPNGKRTSSDGSAGRSTPKRQGRSP